MSGSLIYITEKEVEKLLEWNSIVEAVETALLASAQKRTSQKSTRTFTSIPNTDNLLLCMPGYLKHRHNSAGILACKLVTVFPENKSLPTVMANTLLFDEETGLLKSIIQTTELTAWRTAAASVVATKCLHFRRHNGANDCLAVMGAGTQGRIHAIAFQCFFKFKEVRVWNHHLEKAKVLVEELVKLGIPAKVSETEKDCVHQADVIVTATNATKPIVYLDWIKSSVHINAVGVTDCVMELEEQLYRNADVYVDDMEAALAELKHLVDSGIKFKSELGSLLLGDEPLPEASRITVFQSLGMAAEDATVGQLIYDRYMNKD